MTQRSGTGLEPEDDPLACPRSSGTALHLHPVEHQIPTFSAAAVSLPSGCRDLQILNHRSYCGKIPPADRFQFKEGLLGKMARSMLLFAILVAASLLSVASNGAFAPSPSAAKKGQLSGASVCDAVRRRCAGAQRCAAPLRLSKFTTARVESAMIGDSRSKLLGQSRVQHIGWNLGMCRSRTSRAPAVCKSIALCCGRRVG